MTLHIHLDGLPRGLGKMGRSGFAGIAKVAAIAAGLAFAGMVAGCDAESVAMAGKKGVPLTELDLSGASPTAIALMGPDTVRVTEGDKLAIEIEGSDEMVAAMRFTLDGETLGILRSKSAPEDEKAVVLVTMPAPGSIVVAGSGKVQTGAMARNAEVVIAGSGSAIGRDLDVDSLDLNIAGSGSYTANGKARALDLSIAGSGSASLKDMTVEKADVSIAGSGDGVFRSDGNVAANIMGSGVVRVIGRAKCEVNSFGSGKLVCEEAADAP